MKRRLLGVVALLVLVALMAPAGADTEQNSCNATQAATASPLIGDTAPTCTFEVSCTATTVGCIYGWTLDVNGTGLVDGTMTAEVVSPNGEAFWFTPGGGEVDNPTCSGLLQCHASYSTENPVLLAVSANQPGGVGVRVTCSAGSLGVLVNVGCGLVAVEFGPVG